MKRSFFRLGLIGDPSIGKHIIVWAGHKGVIVLLLDAEGKVDDKQFVNLIAEGFLAKARRWLRVAEQ